MFKCLDHIFSNVSLYHKVVVLLKDEIVLDGDSNGSRNHCGLVGGSFDLLESITKISVLNVFKHLAKTNPELVRVSLSFAVNFESVLVI